MTKHAATWITRARLIGGLAIIALVMAGCNLAGQAPPEGLDVTPTTLIIQPQNVASPTPTQGIVVPPTITPTAALLPAEVLGPITIDGTGHRTTEPITVKVTRGKSVSAITCSWVLQGTGQTGQLGTPTTTQLNEETFVETYTFTPDAAGTYTVNCTGVATTLSGQRAVSANGTPFAVEAKG